jgi:hypothetical protein
MKLDHNEEDVPDLGACGLVFQKFSTAAGMAAAT